MTMFKLIVATILPAVLAALIYIAEKKTKFGKCSYKFQQTVIGIIFGLVAILATETGIPLNGAVLNVRTAAPITAGLLFGAPAGILAGIIGGVERWFAVYWGVGEYTRLACTLATIASGFFAAFMRKYMFDDKKASYGACFSIGLTMEVLHMLLVFLTNMNDIHTAFTVVRQFAPYMIPLNAVASGLSSFTIQLLSNKNKAKKKEEIQITQVFRSHLMVCVIIAFMITCIFAMVLQTEIAHESITEGLVPVQEAIFNRDTSIYITAFMEILVFAALFINVYFVIKHVVVDNIHKINRSLSKITEGDLNEIVDVRDNEEFASLTDDINSTVTTLKHYIDEAEARMDRELKLAKEIQTSALPSVFPPFPGRGDFDIYAQMHAAKQVGGDFYDFYLLGENRLMFLIADVSGKGIPGAMFMMRAKSVIKSLAETGASIDEIMTRANARLCEGNEAGMFVTVWAGIIDLSSGELQYANAGHNPPLIKRVGGQFEFMKTKANLVMAGYDGTKYQKHEIMMKPGDEIFLYTDGVTEAINEKIEMLGDDRLIEIMNENPDDNVEKRCKHLTNSLNEFVGEAEQFDDITMVSMKVDNLHTDEKITVHPDADSTAKVCEFLDERLDKLEVSAKAVNRVRICVDEIYSNVVRYSGANEASVLFHHENDELTLEFCDDGKPFDPTKTEKPDLTLSVEDRPIGGLGILMVKKSVSSMEYKNENGCNILTLKFDFSKEK